MVTLIVFVTKSHTGQCYYIQDLEKILLHQILKASREQDSQEQISFPLLFQIQKLQYSVNTGGSTITDTQTGHGSAAF